MAQKTSLAAGLYRKLDQLFNKEGVSKADFAKLLVGQKNDALREKLWKLFKSGQTLSTEFVAAGGKQPASKAPKQTTTATKPDVKTLGTYPQTVEYRAIPPIIEKIELNREALTQAEALKLRGFLQRFNPNEIAPLLKRLVEAMGVETFTVIKSPSGDRINNLTPQQIKSSVLRQIRSSDPSLEAIDTEDPQQSYDEILTGDYLGVPPNKFGAPFYGAQQQVDFVHPDKDNNIRKALAEQNIVPRVEPSEDLKGGVGEGPLGSRVLSRNEIQARARKRALEEYQLSAAEQEKMQRYESGLDAINQELAEKYVGINPKRPSELRQAAKDFAVQNIDYEYRVMDYDATRKRKLAKTDKDANQVADMLLEFIIGTAGNKFIPTGQDNLTGREFAGTKISTAKEYSPQRAKEIVIGRQTTTPEHEDAREVLIDYLYGKLSPGQVASAYIYHTYSGIPLSNRDVIRELEIEALVDESIAANENTDLLGDMEINPSATEGTNIFLNPLAGGGSVEDKLAEAESKLESKWQQITQQAIAQFEPIVKTLLGQVVERTYDKKTRSEVFRKNPALKKYSQLSALYETVQKTSGFDETAELLEQAITEHGGFSDYYKYNNVSGQQQFVGVDVRLLKEIDYRNFVADYVSEKPRTEDERLKLRRARNPNTLRGLTKKLFSKITRDAGIPAITAKQALPGERGKKIKYKDESGKTQTRFEKFSYGDDFKEAVKQYLTDVTGRKPAVKTQPIRQPGLIKPSKQGRTQLDTKLGRLGRLEDKLRTAQKGGNEDKIRQYVSEIDSITDDLASQGFEFPAEELLKKPAPKPYQFPSGKNAYSRPAFDESLDELNLIASQASQPESFESDDIKKEQAARNKISKAIARHNNSAGDTDKINPGVVNDIYVVKSGRRFVVLRIDDVAGIQSLGTYSKVLKNINQVLMRLLSTESVTKPTLSGTSELFPTEPSIGFLDYSVPRIDTTGFSGGIIPQEVNQTYGQANPGDNRIFVNENVLRDLNPKAVQPYSFGHSAEFDDYPVFTQLDNPNQINVGANIPLEAGAENIVDRTAGDPRFQTPEDAIRQVRAHETAHMAFPTLVTPSPDGYVVHNRPDQEVAIEQAAYGALNPALYDPMVPLRDRLGETGLPQNRIDAPPLYADPYRPSYLPEQAYNRPLDVPRQIAPNIANVEAQPQALPPNQPTFAVNPAINLAAFDMGNLPPVDVSNVNQDNTFTYGGVDPTVGANVQQGFVPGGNFNIQPSFQFGTPLPGYPQFGQPMDTGFIPDRTNIEEFLRQNVAGESGQPYDASLMGDSTPVGTKGIKARLAQGVKQRAIKSGQAVVKGAKAVKGMPKAANEKWQALKNSKVGRGVGRIEGVVGIDEMFELGRAAWEEGQYRKGGDSLVGGKYVGDPVKDIVIGRDVKNFDQLLMYLASNNQDGLDDNGNPTGIAYLSPEELLSLDGKRRKIMRDVRDGYYESALIHPLMKELYGDIAEYTADEDKPFGRTINILEEYDSEELDSTDWSARGWDVAKAAMGSYKTKSVSEPENFMPKTGMVYIPGLSELSGGARSYDDVAQFADAVAGFALTYRVPGVFKSKILNNVSKRGLQGIAGLDAVQAIGSSMDNYDDLGDGFLSKDNSFTVRLRENVDANKFNGKKADEKLWGEIADSVPYTNLYFWTYDKETDTLTNRISETKIKPKDAGIPNYGDKLDAFIKYRSAMQDIEVNYSMNPIEMNSRESEIVNAYRDSGLDWTDEDLGYTYAQKRKDEAAKEARMTGTTFGFDAETYTGSMLSNSDKIDRSVFDPKIDTITVHYDDDDDLGNVELYDRRSAEATGSFFTPSAASTAGGREPGFWEVGQGKFIRKAGSLFGDLRNAIPGTDFYRRDRKYYRVIGDW